MATNSIKDSPDPQELEGIQNPSRNDQILPAEPQTSQPTVAELEKKRKKRQYDQKSRANKKKKEESNQKLVKTLRAKVSRCRGELDAWKNFNLDPVKELKETVACMVEKQTAETRTIWEVLEKSQLTCGSISATTDEVAYPPLELSVMGMSSNRLFMTESFMPCQSVPEEWAQLATGPSGPLIQAFFGLKGHYTASSVRNADEIARLRQAMEVCRAEKEEWKKKWKELADGHDPASFFVDYLDHEASHEVREQ